MRYPMVLSSLYDTVRDVLLTRRDLKYTEAQYQAALTRQENALAANFVLETVDQLTELNFSRSAIKIALQRGLSYVREQEATVTLHKANGK